MASMGGLDIAALLDPQDDFSKPETRQAMANALRKQYQMGTLGQLMGTQPTQQVGAALQDTAQGSLKAALAKQQAERERKTSAEQYAAAEAWRNKNYDQRDRQIAATAANQQASRAASGPIIDTETGKVRVGPDNVVTPILDNAGTQVKPLPKPPTESQSTLATYAARVEQNLPVMTGMLDKGYTPSAKDYGLIASGAPPLIATVSMSDQGKLFYGTSSQIVNAIMRRESGAAISASEWAHAFSRWLPAPGDPPELLAQKRANLNQEMEQLKIQAGPAYKGLGKSEEGVGSSPGAMPAPAPAPTNEIRRTIKGKNYVKRGSEWFEE